MGPHVTRIRSKTSPTNVQYLCSGARVSNPFPCALYLLAMIYASGRLIWAVRTPNRAHQWRCLPTRTSWNGQLQRPRGLPTGLPLRQPGQLAASGACGQRGRSCRGRPQHCRHKRGQPPGLRLPTHQGAGLQRVRGAAATEAALRRGDSYWKYRVPCAQSHPGRGVSVLQEYVHR